MQRLPLILGGVGTERAHRHRVPRTRHRPPELSEVPSQKVGALSGLGDVGDVCVLRDPLCRARNVPKLREHLRSRADAAQVVDRRVVAAGAHDAAPEVITARAAGGHGALRGGVPRVQKVSVADRRGVAAPHATRAERPLADDEGDPLLAVAPQQRRVGATALTDERAHPLDASGTHPTARGAQRIRRVKRRVKGVVDVELSENVRSELAALL